MKPFNIAVFQTTAIIQDQSTSRQHPLPVRPHMDDDGCYSFREYTQVLNVVVETDTDVLSLIRYFPDLVEFDHLIKSHYSKVKIPFPTLTDTAEKRRSFRQFWTSLSQTRVKSDSEKIERYLQKCSLDPTIRSSTIFRDFFSVQREEDRRLSKLEIDRILGQSVAPPLPATEAAATTMTAAASSSSNLDRRRSSSDAVVPEQVSPDTDPVQLGVSEKEVPNEKKAEGTKRLSLAVESHDIVEKNARPQLVEYTASNEDVAKIAPDFPSPYPPPAPAPTAKRPSSQPVVKSSKNPLNQLEMLKVLGKGCMGKVFLVRSKVTNDLYALKSITKELVIEQREITHTLAERDILVALAGADHPFLAKLYLSFQDEHRLYLVTDYYCGGDLATQMSTCTTFSKERTLFYAAEMIEGLGALHRMGILYRDLKPENILLTVDGHIVLTDFGLSKWLATDKDGYLQHTQTFCGTAEYLAPEALLGEPYGFGIDYWAYGTILYEMLAGITPFWADNHSDMYHRVLQDPLEFPPDTDYETAEFLAGLLERDPQMRLGVRGGVEEIKSHIYFSGISWDDVYHRRLKPPYVPQLQSALDFANFDPTFLEMSPTLTPVPSQTDLTADMQRVFDGYSFTNETFLVQEQHEEEQEETTTPQVGQDANKALDNNYFSSSNTFDWDDDVKDVDRKRCTMDRIDEQQMEEHRLHNDLHPTFQPARKRGSMSMLSDIDSFHLDGVVSSVGDVSKLATSNGDMLPYSHDDYRKAEQVRYAKRRNTSGSERDAVEDEIDYAYRQQMSESIVVSEQMPLTPQRVPDLSVASTADDLPFDDFELGGISDDLDLKLSFSVQLEHAANNAKAKAGHAASSKSSSSRLNARRFFSPLLKL